MSFSCSGVKTSTAYTIHTLPNFTNTALNYIQLGHCTKDGSGPAGAGGTYVESEVAVQTYNHIYIYMNDKLNRQQTKHVSPILAAFIACRKLSLSYRHLDLDLLAPVASLFLGISFFFPLINPANSGLCATRCSINGFRFEQKTFLQIFTCLSKQMELSLDHKVAELYRK